MRALLLLAWVIAWLGEAAAEPTPKYDYTLHCAGCHRLDGSGSDVVPALDEVGRVLDAGGREYLARVPGVAQAPLSDERLAALLNWLLPTFGKRSPLPPYSATEVGRLRAAPLRDPFEARDNILADSTDVTNKLVPLPGGVDEFKRTCEAPPNPSPALLAGED